MQMITLCMITRDGIPGEDSLKEMRHINLGYGLQEIMKLILPLILYVVSPLI